MFPEHNFHLTFKGDNLEDIPTVDICCSYHSDVSVGVCAKTGSRAARYWAGGNTCNTHSGSSRANCGYPCTADASASHTGPGPGNASG